MLVASIASFFINELQRLAPVWVYGLVVLLVFGEAALFFGFVIPGETAVLIGGVIASQGRVNIGVLCVLVVIAAVVGDTVGFEVGKHYGARLLELRIFRARRGALDQALEGLKRRGPTYVFVGRFTAFLRAVMPGLAGMSKMRYRRFFLANAAGGLVWGVAYALLGYYGAHVIVKVEKYSNDATYALLAVIVIVVVVLHVRRKRNEARLEATTEPPEALAKREE